jgi:hypothetical protein
MGRQKQPPDEASAEAVAKDRDVEELLELLDKMRGEIRKSEQEDSGGRSRDYPHPSNGLRPRLRGRFRNAWVSFRSRVVCWGRA